MARFSVSRSAISSATMWSVGIEPSDHAHSSFIQCELARMLRLGHYIATTATKVERAEKSRKK
jgi:hypothetical protein